MTEHIKPCLICGSNDIDCEKYDYSVYYGHYVGYRIECNDCGTIFGNLEHEDTKEEIINWYNSYITTILRSRYA